MMLLGVKIINFLKKVITTEEKKEPIIKNIIIIQYIHIINKDNKSIHI